MRADTFGRPPFTSYVKTGLRPRDLQASAETGATTTAARRRSDAEAV